MPKNIVFCADGTWDHPGSTSEVSATDSNVYKLFKACHKTPAQATFYDDGLGVDGLAIEKVAGGAFGTGIFGKVKDGYTDIAQVYEQDDRIFIFGFSRGAYTARSLAGMIAACGLPTKNFDQHLVDTAFHAYRSKDDRAAILANLAPNALYNAKITMLGVWDTVGALGIPGALFGDNHDLLYGFLDTGLHPNVKAAYQAMSIDERRVEFKPTLWTGQPPPGQILEQVWFPGVHCDVGGGYAETGLSDIALSWMLNNAIANGMTDVDLTYQTMPAKSALDHIHESWKLLFGFPQRRSIPADAVLANSTTVRMAGEVGYHPSNLLYDSQGQPSGYSIEQVVSVGAAASA